MHEEWTVLIDDALQDLQKQYYILTSLKLSSVLQQTKKVDVLLL